MAAARSVVMRAEPPMAARRAELDRWGLGVDWVKENPRASDTHNRMLKLKNIPIHLIKKQNLSILNCTFSYSFQHILIAQQVIHGLQYVSVLT